MLNRKQVCESSRTCETGKTFNGAATFFLMPVYNNRFNPKFENSKTDITTGFTTTGVPITINTDRVDAELCENDNKQARLSLRRKPTPYRVPYNHYRKTFNQTLDTANCTKNEKIIKDVLGECDTNGQQICPSVTYTTTRFVNKFGFRNTNNGGNYKNYLQNSGKLYNQNTFGILPENKANKGFFLGKQNLYKINTVNGTRQHPDCKLAYKRASSFTNVEGEQQLINTATLKYANPGYNSRTSVSSGNRVQRLKYNAKIASQNNRNGYNNCINGQECSKYTNPGPNTKLFSFTPTRAAGTCNPSRINGMLQRCPPPPPPPPIFPTNISIIPSSNKVGDTPARGCTTENIRGLTISFDLSANLSIGDTIEIIFSNPNFFHIPPSFPTSGIQAGSGLNLSEQVGSLSSSYLAVGTSPFPDCFSSSSYNSFIETITDPSFNFPLPVPYTAVALANTTSSIKIVLKEPVSLGTSIYIQIQDDDGKVVQHNPSVGTVITGTLKVSHHEDVTNIPGWTVQL